MLLPGSAKLVLFLHSPKGLELKGGNMISRFTLPFTGNFTVLGGKI